MRRPSIPETSRLHRLPLLADLATYVVGPSISGIRRARQDRTEGEPAQAWMGRAVRNSALPALLGLGVVGGCLALEGTALGQRLAQSPVMQRSWLNRLDLVQLGAGAVHSLTVGAIEVLKPEAMGLAPSQRPKGRRAAKAAVRNAAKNLLSDSAQMAAFKGLGLGLPIRR